MTPATLIQKVQADGVMLALSPAGTIKATGDGTAVTRWLALIRERKAEIVEALREAGSQAPCEHRSGPTSGEWSATVQELCALRGDDPEHQQALLDDYADLSPESRAAWLGVFHIEIAALAVTSRRAAA